MPTTEESILQLTRQLYPTGRVWNLPEGGFFESLHKALAISEGKAWDDAAATMDALIPDTDRFTADDATDWEPRWGIITNPATPLADRKAAILQKMQAPGRNPAHGHYLSIQTQLQLAGFNVYVFENLDPIYGGGYNYFNPNNVNPSLLTNSQHGDHQHGDVQSAYINSIVVNSLYNDEDIAFNLGGMQCTFFICGSVFGTPANVPASREKEFRQLILRLKQVQTQAILIVTYI